MTAICQKKNKGMRAWLRKNAVGYAFLMPFLVLFAIFVIVPVGVAMYYSLTNYNMIQAPKFVGLSNYAQLILDDDVFLISLKNTLLLAVVTGPLGYFASFLMAWIITLVKKGRGFFSMAFYAPSLTSRITKGRPTATKPRKNISEPIRPKKCMGLAPNLPVNHNVIRSR